MFMSAIVPCQVPDWALASARCRGFWGALWRVALCPRDFTPGVSVWPVARFHGHQAIQFSADVGHAPGDHHATGSRRALASFMDMHNAQAGLTLGWLSLAVRGQGARR